MIKFHLSLSLENVKLNSKDSLFVCGSSSCLGEWNLTKAVEMKMKLIDDQNSLSSFSSYSSLNDITNDNP